MVGDARWWSVTLLEKSDDRRMGHASAGGG